MDGEININADVNAIVEKINELGETTATAAFEAATQAVYWEAVFTCIGWGIGLSVLLTIWIVAMFLVKKYGATEDFYIALVVGGCGNYMVGVVGLITVSDTIPKLMTPEWYAIKEILRAIM